MIRSRKVLEAGACIDEEDVGNGWDIFRVMMAGYPSTVGEVEATVFVSLHPIETIQVVVVMMEDLLGAAVVG
jgi:hypothetical protein